MGPFKKLKRRPLLIAIGISTLLITLLGYLGKDSIYAEYRVDLVKVPQLAVVFQGIKDANYPWDIFAKGKETAKDAKKDEIIDVAEQQNEEGNEAAEVNNPDNNPVVKDEGTVIDQADKGDSDKSNQDKNTDENYTGKTDSDKSDTGSTDSDKTDMDKTDTDKSDTEKSGTDKGHSENNATDKDIINTEDNNAKTENKEKTENKDKTNEKDTTDTNTGKQGEEHSFSGFETVKESYFNDALFIGDSRTVGLKEYSGWTKPTYYADTGLNIFEVFDKDIAEVDGKKTSLEKGLEKKKFSKIYIMLGINELGRGTTKSFAKEYQTVIERIQKLQPDAIIYIEAIMNVTKKKSDADPIFNNKNIKDRNGAIALLADNKRIFYIDVNEAIVDKTGGIPEKYTFDGVHLKASYYKIWTDFLLKHGIK